jgi:hypothetical protein
MIDTPDTDAMVREILSGLQSGTMKVVHADFARKLERERNEARRKLKIASVPLCVGEPIISILAKHGQWVSEDDRGVIAASDLFQHNPYDERDQLRKACDGYSQAWNLYKVFPSLANEKLFEISESNYNSLPHVIERNKAE